MIEIIFLDVDGTLTDGGIYKTNSGDEFKKFDVRDGFGIQEWLRLGKKVAIITGKSSQIVENRARELKIPYFFQGIKDKFAKAKEILELENLSFANAAAIGDDLNDAKLLNAVKISFKPQNALHSVKADITLNANGGNGAVREMIEYLVDMQNLRDEWNKPWL